MGDESGLLRVGLVLLLDAITHDLEDEPVNGLEHALGKQLFLMAFVHLRHHPLLHFQLQALDCIVNFLQQAL